MDLKYNVKAYLEFCKKNKGLSDKTIKAYRIDLNQLIRFYENTNEDFNKKFLVSYISELSVYKPKTSKRKIASLKAFCSYLECEDIIEYNPFHKIKTKFKEPIVLPKIILTENINILFKYLYNTLSEKSKDTKEYNYLLRDITAIELLFCTGARISEVCNLKKSNFDWSGLSVKFLGKGSKERVVYITNPDVIKVLKEYYNISIGVDCEYFFINRLNSRLSEQSLRFSIYKYVKEAKISQHINPHMFRHSFATLLLDDDVDIRYIQNILGHSSITTTQIYTHVSLSKQKEIMTKNNPRNHIKI